MIMSCMSYLCWAFSVPQALNHTVVFNPDHFELEGICTCKMRKQAQKMK